MKQNILFILIVILSSQFGYSQSGELDSSFGINGRVTTNFQALPALTRYTSIAIQADGKIVAAGYSIIDEDSVLALARYNTDGSLDTTFSSDGKVTDSLRAFSLAIQKDGKILVAGSALARYNADGGIDSTFSEDGKITSAYIKVSTITLQNDGKLLVAGSKRFPAHFTLSRYNTNGTPDSTFSQDGEIVSSEVQSILVQSDGKITTVGYRYRRGGGDSTFFIMLARYTISGSPDSTFNGNGILNTYRNKGSWRTVTAAVMQKDGKIVVRGPQGFFVSLVRFKNDGSVDNSFGTNGEVVSKKIRDDAASSSLAVQSDGKILIGSNSGQDFALARYTIKGGIDSGFGTDGVQVTKVTGEFDVITALANFNDKIYAAGTGDYFGNTSAIVACYTNDGSPDQSFGTNGIAEIGFPSNRGSTAYYTAALQTDGKIVAAGSNNNGSSYDFAVARYNTDGSLDDTFSNDGKLITGFGGDQYSSVSSVAAQENGKIVAIGTTSKEGRFIDGNIAIVRYNTDGSLDSTFNNSGKQTINFGDAAIRAGSVAVQQDGKIVVVGTTSSGTVFSHFAVARFNENGSLDSTFDGDARQTTDVSGKFSAAHSVAIQMDGKIVVAGISSLYGNDGAFAVVRYNNDGSLDKTFNGTGKQNSQPGYSRYPSALVLQADGKILVSGRNEPSLPNPLFTVIRYNVNGTVDTSFNKDGKFTSSFIEEATSVAVDTKGRILAGGSNSNYAGFVSLNSDGSFNTNFSGDGMMIDTISGSSSDPLRAIAIAKNKFYAVGTTNKDFGIVSRFILEEADQMPPSISLINPPNNSTYLAGGNVYLTAAASDADGTISKVEFYKGATLLYAAKDTPYTFKWPKVNVGNYTVTAKATDNSGLVTTSAPVHISVDPNKAPSVSIISPANGENFIAPATINLGAAAADPDGRIIKVDFYNGATLLNTAPERKAPYTYQWQNVPAGVYNVAAVAQDNWGETSASAPVTVTVTSNGIVSSKPSPLNNKASLKNEISLKLVPNPAKRLVSIYTTGLQSDKQTTLSIISASGVIMKTIKIAGSNQTIPLDVSSLASGVYSIKIISGEKVIYRKLVKL